MIDAASFTKRAGAHQTGSRKGLNIFPSGNQFTFKATKEEPTTSNG